ncbi:MAG: alpha/beta family hydrolase [Candidatus Nanopelagicales bacterium]
MSRPPRDVPDRTDPPDEGDVPDVEATRPLAVAEAPPGEPAPQEPVVREVETSVGTARVHITPPAYGVPRATLVLGHGAGGGTDSADLAALVAALPADGVEVVLVEQPWRVAGKRVAERPPRLDAAWTEVLTDLRRHGYAARRLVVGGRSAGARVACRTAATVRPDAVLCLAFPLHPPGRRGASRLDELAEATAVAPVVVVQGARDAFGGPDEVAGAALELGVSVLTVAVPYADHSFKVPARAPVTQAETLQVVVSAARQLALGARSDG